MTESSSGSLSDPGYWSHLYRAQRDRWDLGRPAPSLVALLDSTEAPPRGRVVVPGCGRGYDALLLAARGYSVLGFDFAAEAIADATRLALRQGARVTFEQQDLFALPEAYTGSFDLVFEHTLFCAIDPSRRPEYVEVMHRLLKPGGEFVGIFFVHPRPGGPPFRTEPAEINSLFASHFLIRQLAPAPISVPERRGEEAFGRFVKK
jgi:SAM-dependent methyltransferase